MSGTTTELTAAVQEYFADLRRVRASGGATQEWSLYGPLRNLLTAVGATLRPKVFCVQELADQGAGHPDFGLYAAKQVQRGMPREGQTPERGVIEVKSPADDAWLTASSDLEGFARDLGHVDETGAIGSTFPWDDERRLHLQAKLDAVFFHLYGVTDRDDVRYIWSTFPIVERQDTAAYGRYRSRDLCLTYMNALAAGRPDTVPSG